MNPIGGYFELELPRGEEYHKNAIRLNTGRNAFEYVLRAKGYKKVFLPYYTCDVMLEPVHKLKLNYDFYHIDQTFRPEFDFTIIKEDDVFVYNNYFGICDKQVNEVSNKCKNLIIDNAQAFYSKPLSGIDTFYSPRKFFGVPDGAYLYTDKEIDFKLEQDISFQRCEHLLGRIDSGAEDFYEKFKANDQNLSNQQMKRMSNLTLKLLKSINYISIKNKRQENFKCVNDSLKSFNELRIETDEEDVPMVYPFLKRGNTKTKEFLLKNKIFTATYWPSVKGWLNKSNCYESYLVDNLISIPIDQRYDIEDLRELLKHILEFYYINIVL